MNQKINKKKDTKETTKQRLRAIFDKAKEEGKTDK